MGKYAIFIVSALIFSLLTYSSALRNALFMSNTRTIESHSINQAYNIAQSAMMIAVKDITENGEDSPFHPEVDESYAYPSYNGFQNWSEMHGSYNILTSNQGDSLLTVQSTGQFEELTYLVTVGLVKTSGGGGWVPNIDQAVHAENSIALNGSSSIQGDASINSIQPGAVDFQGWPATITGNLFIGPNGDPDEVAPKISKWHPGHVGGDIFVMEEELEYEMPQFPTFPGYSAVGNSVELKGVDSQTLNPSDYTGLYIPEISVKSNTNLTIHVGDQDRSLVVGDFDIDQGHVYITGTGKLNLYVQDDMTLNGSSTINSTGDVNQVFMYYKGSSELAFRGATSFNGGIFAETANVTLGGSNSLKGTLITGGSDVEIHGAASAESRVVFAPNAHVVLKGSGTIYGSVISDTFEAKGNSHVIYRDDLDSELPDLGGSGGGDPTFSISYWN